ncbi:MAG TPA: hypothetical protein VKR58_01275 [Aquella sp.]|nr:hypothetical protein [Aquella sp.]
MSLVISMQGCATLGFMAGISHNCIIGDLFNINRVFKYTLIGLGIGGLFGIAQIIDVLVANKIKV